MEFDQFGIPFKINLNANFEKKVEKKIFDSKVFPQCTNKIEDVGRLKPKKYLIRSDWNGKIWFEELRDPIETIKKLAELRDEGLLTEEEFQQKKKELLERV